MSMILKIILFLIIAYPIPYLIGLLFRKTQSDRYDICHNIIFGYMAIWALMQITAVPAIYLKVSLNTYTIIICAVVITAVIGSIVSNRKNIPGTPVLIMHWLKSKPWLQIGIILLIIVQTCFVSLTNLGDFDDAFFVATSETALETNTLMEYDPYTGSMYQILPSRYVLSPFPMFVALISRILNVRAATTAHTLLIFALIPLAYMIWNLIGKKLFNNHKQKASVFLLMVMCILVFSGYSVYTQGMFMYVRIWQGKAVLTALILPLVFYLGLCIVHETMDNYHWQLLFLTMTASCFVSSMGIMLAVIMLGIIALSDALIHRNIKNWKNIFICCLPNIVFALLYLFIR